VHKMFQNAGIPEPYVLVGHSYGGAVMQTFASLYPQDVAGMVMVDVVTCAIESNYPKQFRNNSKISRQAMSAFSTLGLFRLMQWLGLMPKADSVFDALPTYWKKTAIALDYNPRMGMTWKAEISNGAERNAQFISAAPRQDVPMIVLVRELAGVIPGSPLNEKIVEQTEQVWREAQIELAAKVTDGTLIAAEGSGHNVIMEKPAVVIEAIKQLFAPTP
jgi:pimeloyl-ACP methyl ester carboxylesterase